MAPTRQMSGNSRTRTIRIVAEGRYSLGSRLRMFRVWAGLRALRRPLL